MPPKTKSMEQQVKDVITRFQLEMSGHAPTKVTVTLDQATLIVTLIDALSPVEVTLSQTETGAAQVQEYHNRLFMCSLPALREELQRVTGVAIQDAAVEFETDNGVVTHTFVNGTVIQLFRLASGIPASKWTGEISSS
ncbi:hypothetical protein Plim_4157 [Planctopirus limnophila DSM 3776]|uniref:Na+-translocating membrane potential-generating system MpsC domain-containing protein n=2 Tax=Planctopirus TaxID=1649480 RepID=D5SZ66_PLAL2|nr:MULTISPECIES: DUF2294 domain-containing protein [Planctopirus]ADG69967.1 hypothetical protein Plim_4157 [Planctopirus limnophila DSM 3776]QDV28831.1 hypothetical protein Spb1_06960 [Planctopirus ephydatiae]